TYILTASSDIELAEEREGDDYGLLTKHIIRGIKEGAADRDDDGFVSVRELLVYVQDEVRKEGKQTPQGYAVRMEDGEMAIARTRRAPREQKRREVLKAIYEAGLNHHLPVRLIRSAIAVLDPGPDQSEGDRATYDQFLDRLHRSSRSVFDFNEALYQLP